MLLLIRSRADFSIEVSEALQRTNITPFTTVNLTAE
jgi:hypothetical protein